MAQAGTRRSSRSKQPATAAETPAPGPRAKRRRKKNPGAEEKHVHRQRHAQGGRGGAARLGAGHARGGRGGAAPSKKRSQPDARNATAQSGKRSCTGPGRGRGGMRRGSRYSGFCLLPIPSHPFPSTPPGPEAGSSTTAAPQMGPSRRTAVMAATPGQRPAAGRTAAIAATQPGQEVTGGATSTNLSSCLQMAKDSEWWLWF